MRYEIHGSKQISLLFKIGNRTLNFKYHKKSIVSAGTKEFEDIIHTNMKHFNKYSVLNDGKYWLRNKHSTESQLT